MWVTVGERMDQMWHLPRCREKSRDAAPHLLLGRLLDGAGLGWREACGCEGDFIHCGRGCGLLQHHSMLDT